MVHAPGITDVLTDVHIVPVDCDLTAHNLLILPTPDVALVLQQGTLTSPRHHLFSQIPVQEAGGTHVQCRLVFMV